jgi:hypothetical protein
MKNKTNKSDTYTKSKDYSFTPLITTVAFPLLIGRLKKGNSIQEKSPRSHNFDLKKSP